MHCVFIMYEIWDIWGSTPHPARDLSLDPCILFYFFLSQNKNVLAKIKK